MENPNLPPNTFDNDFSIGGSQYHIPVSLKGKGWGVTGFVLSLVSFIFLFIIYIIASVTMFYGGGKYVVLACLVVGIAALVCSIIGWIKLKRSRGSKGLAIAGFCVSILSIMLTIICLCWVIYVEQKVHEAMQGFNETFQNSMEDLNNDTLNVE